MSVTFYPAVGDVMTQVTCSCEALVADVLFSSHAEAYKAALVDGTITVPVCGDDICAMYSASFVTVDEIPSVNVSNLNSVQVLDVLGIQVGEEWEARCAGSISAEDFLSRVLVASAVQLVDAGVPVMREGNWISAGRREGYLNEIMPRLQDVAEYAVKYDCEIYWS